VKVSTSCRLPEAFHSAKFPEYYHHYLLDNIDLYRRVAYAACPELKRDRTMDEFVGEPGVRSEARLHALTGEAVVGIYDKDAV
jgi:hypothetical protein